MWAPLRNTLSLHLLLLWLSYYVKTSIAVPIQLHGLNYNTRQGPDWDWNKCKSRPQVQTDLALLKQLTNRIRILSLKDCDQGVLVSSVAREFGMQLWLGMWVGLEAWVFEEEKGTLQYMIDQGMFQDDTILGVSVGSEAIYRKDATVDQMIRNINEVYAILQANGIDIPVTIVDVAPIYSSSAALRRAVNVTMTNTFPFWEGQPIENAVNDLQLDLDWLINLPESRNKPFVLGETGWPSDGFIEGVGIAGADLQRRFFQEAYCRMHVENQWAYYWFTGIDNAWRQEQDPQNTIEGNFGIFYADLTLKEHFRDLTFQCSDGLSYSFAEIDFTIPSGFTPAPAVVDPASCQAHPQCTELFGNCCPNDFGDILGCCDRTVPTPPRVTTMPQSRPTLTPSTEAPVTAPTVSPVRRITANPTVRPVYIATATPTGVPSLVSETDAPTVSSATPVVVTATVAPSVRPTSAAPQRGITVQPTNSDVATTVPTAIPTEPTMSSVFPVSPPTSIRDEITPFPAPEALRPLDESFPPTRTPTASVRVDSGAASVRCRVSVGTLFIVIWSVYFLSF